jgi:hypothetical protein
MEPFHPAWQRAGYRSKNIHSLRYGKRTAAASAITLGIKPFGAGHYRRVFCLQAILGSFQGLGCRLVIELRANRLSRHQSRVRISRGLPDGGFKLRNVCAARTGLSDRRVQAENRAKEWSRSCSKFYHPNALLIPKSASSSARTL